MQCPKLFFYAGDPINILLGDALQVKKVNFRHDGALYYARTKLPLIAPNVQTLVLSTRAEVSSSPPNHFIVLQIYVYNAKLLILGIQIIFGHLYFHQTVHTPMASSKFLQLKYLEIVLCTMLPLAYDFYSLVSFLDASPALETFILRVSHQLYPKSRP